MNVINRIAGGSRSSLIASAIEAHVAQLDQSEAGKAAVLASWPQSWAPLSAVRAHPTRWPAQLKAYAAARRSSALRQPSRMHLLRADDGNEAEPPVWPRMEPGDRVGGPIPANQRMGVPVRPEKVHTRYVRAQPEQSASAGAVTQAMASRSMRDGALARLAVLQRQRVENWMWSRQISREISGLALAPIEQLSFSR